MDLLQFRRVSQLVRNGTGEAVVVQMKFDEFRQVAEFRWNRPRQLIVREIQNPQPVELAELRRKGPGSADARQTESRQVRQLAQFRRNRCLPGIDADEYQLGQLLQRDDIRRYVSRQAVVGQVEPGHAPLAVGVDAVPFAKRRVGQPVRRFVPLTPAQGFVELRQDFPVRRWLAGLPGPLVHGQPAEPFAQKVLRRHAQARRRVAQLRQRLKTRQRVREAPGKFRIAAEPQLPQKRQIPQRHRQFSREPVVRQIDCGHAAVRVGTDAVSRVRRIVRPTVCICPAGAIRRFVQRVERRLVGPIAVVDGVSVFHRTQPRGERGGQGHAQIQIARPPQVEQRKLGQLHGKNALQVIVRDIEVGEGRETTEFRRNRAGEPIAIHLKRLQLREVPELGRDGAGQVVREQLQVLQIRHRAEFRWNRAG